MDVFTFVIAVVVLSGVVAPLAKGLGNRIARGGAASVDRARLDRLAAELESTEQRLADTERRLVQAEERLDFQERLLSSRSSAPDRTGS